MRTLLLTLCLVLAGPAVAQPVAAAVAGALVVGSSGNRIAGSGRAVDDVRTPGSFSAIRVSGPIDVELKASEREQVTVRFDDNLVSVVETQVTTDATPALEIRLQPGASFRSGGSPKVIVEFKSISSLSLSGSGDVHADAVRGPLMAVSVAGSSDVKVDRLDVDVLGVSIAGSGDFTAAGRATEQGYSIAGSGDIKAENLVGQTVKVRIAGSGDARVNAEQMLTVSIAGSGDVIFRGTPVVKKSVAGTGEVRKAN
jgi:Putative auto-transporter adhesin, head GIN domain